MRRFVTILAAAALAATIAAPAAAAGGPAPRGAVFTQTNDPAGNQVVVWTRYADGTLVPSGSVATGGLGTGSEPREPGRSHAERQRALALRRQRGQQQRLHLRRERREPDAHRRRAKRRHDADQRHRARRHRVRAQRRRQRQHRGLLARWRRSDDDRRLDTPAQQRGRGPRAGRLLQQRQHPDRDREGDQPDRRLPDRQSGLGRAPTVVVAPGTTPFGFVITANGTLVVSEAATGSASSFRIGPKGGLRVVSSAPCPTPKRRHAGSPPARTAGTPTRPTPAAARSRATGSSGRASSRCSTPTG